MLVGEPGIGKSRLGQAILGETEANKHLVVQYQCSPYRTGTALWPVLQQFTLAARLGPSDDDRSKMAKIEVLLHEGTQDVKKAAALIAVHLGIEPDARYPVLSLTPNQQRALTLAVLVDQVFGPASRQPVLMVVEDVQWADPATFEFISQVLDRIACARLLMVLTSRAGKQPNLTLARLRPKPGQAHMDGEALVTAAGRRYCLKHPAYELHEGTR